MFRSIKTARLAIAAASVAALAVTTACSSGSDGASDGDDGGKTLKKASLRLDWLPTGYHAPLFLAAQEGYYKDEGIDLEILDGKGSSTTIQLIATGKETFGFAGVNVLAKGSGEVKNVKMICGFIQQNPNAIISLQGSGIESVKDIEGKTYGHTPGSETSPFSAVAGASGVAMDKVKTVQLTPDTMYSALLQGQVDFIHHWVFTDGVKINRTKTIATPILDSENGADILGSGLIATTDTLEKDPDLVRGFLKATIKGMEAAVADPDKAVDAMVKARPGVSTDKDLMLEQMKGAVPFLHTKASEGDPYCKVAQEDLERTDEIMKKYDDLPTSISVVDLATNEYLP